MSALPRGLTNCSSLPRPHARPDNFKHIGMIYLKSILAGAVAFVVTVVIFGAAAFTVMAHYPQLALRMLPAQRHDLAWGSFYEVNFPFLQIVIVGLIAFAITFAWLVRRAAAARRA